MLKKLLFNPKKAGRQTIRDYESWAARSGNNLRQPFIANLTDHEIDLIKRKMADTWYVRIHPQEGAKHGASVNLQFFDLIEGEILVVEDWL